jgi:hypothetical protein
VSGTPRTARARNDQGSAVVEFALLTIVAIVPLAWAGLALQQLAAVHQATQTAAGESLRAFLTADSEPSGRRQAELAAALALTERPGVRSYDVVVGCGSTRCLQPGTTVRVGVTVRAELPQIPVLGLTPSLTAQAEQYGVVDAFAAAR